MPVMAAKEAKRVTFDLDELRGEVKSMYRAHGEDIRSNAILRMGAGVWAKMKFLLEELDKSGDMLDEDDETDA